MRRMMVFFGVCVWVVSGASFVMAEETAAASKTEAAAAVTTADMANSTSEDSSAASDATMPPAPSVDATASSAAPVSADVAAPAPITPPALKPITITFSGEVVSADAAGSMVTIQDRYGVKKEIAVPSDTKISQGTAAKTLADLKAGDKVTVEYTYDVASNKRTAQSISVGEGAK